MPGPAGRQILLVLLVDLAHLFGQRGFLGSLRFGQPIADLLQFFLEFPGPLLGRLDHLGVVLTEDPTELSAGPLKFPALLRREESLASSRFRNFLH
jgi:hypothetical protein